MSVCVCSFNVGQNFPQIGDGVYKDATLQPLYVRRTDSLLSYGDLLEVLVQKAETDAEYHNEKGK